MATIISDTTATAADGTTVQTIIYSDGGRSVQTVPGPGTPAANLTTIQGKALTALTANATYLAISVPTNAQVAAQVALLTKESNGVIRLLLGRLDSTSGT